MVAIDTLFSGEERYGLCLDLYASHSQYNNLRHLPKRLQYLQYLDALASSDKSLHPELGKECKHTKEYEQYVPHPPILVVLISFRYLQTLYNYLLSFSKRTQPLVDVDALQQTATQKFSSLWEANEVPGWEAPKPAENGDGIWCPACQRHYAKQTVYDAHLTSKKHIKAQTKLDSEGTSTAAANGANGHEKKPTNTTSKVRHAALLTYLITTLLVPLLPTLAETKANVERRFSLTAKEREEELTSEAPVAAPPNPEDGQPEEEQEEEERIYNPLKLPLGWDGKPIPYWLYKLHGLGVEYRCEICSDYVYMGRKNFERHFQVRSPAYLW